MITVCCTYDIILLSQYKRTAGGGQRGQHQGGGEGRDANSSAQTSEQSCHCKRCSSSFKDCSMKQ